MIAPVPVPPCSRCCDLSRLYRPWTWPPNTHPVPFSELHGLSRTLRDYYGRLPAALYGKA